VDLPEEKYLFKLSQHSYMDKIMDQGPRNVKGSLLILKTWSSELSFDEVELILCPFWVQIHGLLRHNMTARNAT
jgi:rRNA maturation protein Rpf1